MGFEDSVELVCQYWEKPLMADPAKALIKSRSSIRFMIENMGHLLKRKESSGPDKRVGFIPDRWQKGAAHLCRVSWWIWLTFYKSTRITGFG